MAYATPAERLQVRADRKANRLKYEFTILIEKGERQSELVCDSLTHALTLANTWHNTHGAQYVEIFRVNKDGTLKSTIGPHR